MAGQDKRHDKETQLNGYVNMRERMGINITRLRTMIMMTTLSVLGEVNGRKDMEERKARQTPETNGIRLTQNRQDKTVGT